MNRINTLLLLLLCTGALASCRKVEYRTVSNPAYIRVFNNLTEPQGILNKRPRPFFCMFIDPVMDEKGKITGGATVSDFLNKRGVYAAPNPAHVGLSTSKFNPEYPGKELVPAGPVLNGFDLTNWAQISAGKHRFVFIYRPVSEVPFFQLQEDLRSNIALDTTIELKEKEVYTLHVLLEDFLARKHALYVRQENFYKQAFYDSLVYINFYNLSGKGYLQADESEKDLNSLDIANMPHRFGLKDDMHIYISHISEKDSLINEYAYQFAGTMHWTVNNPMVTPYASFPIFRDKANNGITTKAWQIIQFVKPGINPGVDFRYASVLPTLNVRFGIDYKAGEFGQVMFKDSLYNLSHRANEYMPNMVLNVHSGVDNPRSFGSVNSLEFINGRMYLMTIQRKYAPPVY
ncbi:hypothetical protein HNQ91_002833 [Filimonas zeae]|uniref:Uncharacterized protein n=1 Tax=Filimonas zeae TaxID=1737353 RepID=A0A917IY98_9BACT|nr:hypothetical protein [Filimonas zeae]MDR6339768.1 hypothetical protein [Filimonas zeae]GGH69548.1 hypothetical protein GCM10011379_26960 [Filimonas zeae]